MGRCDVRLETETGAGQTDPMLRRDVITGLCTFAALPACTPQTVAPTARTTVIMVRHADRTGDVLSKRGKARAANLPQALAGYEIDAIYSPDIARNLETAMPLARTLGLPITVIAKERAGAQMSRAHPDGTVIWVGNKGNLRTIWQELAAPGNPPQNYGEVGVITLDPRGQRRVTRLTVPA